MLRTRLMNNESALGLILDWEIVTSILDCASIQVSAVNSEMSWTLQGGRVK